MRLLRFAGISLVAISLGIAVQLLGFSMGIGVAVGFTAATYELLYVK